jgi:hypothetical protein
MSVLDAWRLGTRRASAERGATIAPRGTQRVLRGVNTDRGSVTFSFPTEKV